MLSEKDPYQMVIWSLPPGYWKGALEGFADVEGSLFCLYPHEGISEISAFKWSPSEDRISESAGTSNFDDAQSGSNNLSERRSMTGLERSHFRFHQLIRSIGAARSANRLLLFGLRDMIAAKKVKRGQPVILRSTGIREHPRATML